MSIYEIGLTDVLDDSTVNADQNRYILKSQNRELEKFTLRWKMRKTIVVSNLVKTMNSLVFRPNFFTYGLYINKHKTEFFNKMFLEIEYDFLLETELYQLTEDDCKDIETSIPVSGDLYLKTSKMFDPDGTRPDNLYNYVISPSILMLGPAQQYATPSFSIDLSLKKRHHKDTEINNSQLQRMNQYTEERNYDLKNSCNKVGQYRVGKSLIDVVTMREALKKYPYICSHRMIMD